MYNCKELERNRIIDIHSHGIMYDLHMPKNVWNICNAVNMHCEKGVSEVWIWDIYWWKDLVTLELVLLLPCLKCMRHPFVVFGLLVDAQEITDSHINLKESFLFWNINNKNISKCSLLFYKVQNILHFHLSGKRVGENSVLKITFNRAFWMNFNFKYYQPLSTQTQTQTEQHDIEVCIKKCNHSAVKCVFSIA